MSHFVVIARLPGDTPEDQIENKLEKTLLPYQEYGSSDDVGLTPYLKFNDLTEEVVSNYEKDTTSYVRLPSGVELSAYEQQFRNKDIFAKDQHVYPLGTVEFEKPVKEVYPTLEDYATNYHGYKMSAEGRYGYLHNPNSKWDWYVVGGRWNGYFPVRELVIASAQARQKELGLYDGYAAKECSAEPNKVNVCRISELDFNAANQEAQAELNTFWDEWNELLAGKEFKIFHGPRSTAIDLGFITCKDETELTDEERDETRYRLLPWKRQLKEGVTRFDVARIINKEDLNISVFFPIKGYSRVDESGWYSKGEMGWFGCDQTTPEAVINFSESTKDWLLSGNQQDWVLAVDCHI
jgi:hypothetical protein